MREYMIGDKVVSKTTYHKKRRRAEALGCAIEDVPNMQGRHGNNLRGSANPRWNSGQLVTSHGYVLARVSRQHPHSFGGKGDRAYCYEHIAVMVAHMGRPLSASEVVHHKNQDRTDNRIENLVVMQCGKHVSEHAKARAAVRTRNTDGTFAKLRYRTLPWSMPGDPR